MGTVQVFAPVRDDDGPFIREGADDLGYVNRHGLSRKVTLLSLGS